jgi:hypothetical protein
MRLVMGIQTVITQIIVTTTHIILQVIIVITRITQQYIHLIIMVVMLTQAITLQATIVITQIMSNPQEEHFLFIAEALVGEYLILQTACVFTTVIVK